MDAGDELQRLDDDLAAGRLDATSYRRRRDELISRRRGEEVTPRAAPVGDATADAPAEPESPSALPDPVADTASIPVVEPTSVPGTTDEPSPERRGDGPDPFPPPFRWGDPHPPPDPPADVTQVVDRDAERTQVVPHPPSGAFRPPSFPPPPERTQVVPGGLAGRRPSPPVPAAHTTPPWVERVDRPPTGMQGAEVFLGRRRELASVIGTAAVVVVVILILVLSFTLG